MDFISQYILANTGTAVPIRYTRWSAIALLSTVLGRKVYVNHEHFQLTPWLYFILIGTQGSGKSTAKDQAQDMLTAAIPTYPTGVSITSREDIVRFMSSDACLREYTNEKGELTTWRPIGNFVDELSNFLSFAPGPMIEFMTNIFDRKYYDSSTIKRGKEMILHPYFAFLACTLPDTMISYLRMSVMGGGFLRRTIMIYDTSVVIPVTFPKKSEASLKAEQWCISHLQKIDGIVGQFKWAPGSQDFLDNWNMTKIIPDDPLLAGYYGKKVNLVQKVAMCLAMAEPEPKLLFTRENLELAIAFLDANEDNLPKLTAAVGRNPLAVPQAKMLQEVVNKGGWMPKKLFHRLASQDLNEGEFKSILDLLIKTDQLYIQSIITDGVREEFVLLPDKYQEFLKAGSIIKK